MDLSGPLNRLVPTFMLNLSGYKVSLLTSNSRNNPSITDSHKPQSHLLTHALTYNTSRLLHRINTVVPMTRKARLAARGRLPEFLLRAVNHKY